jgi:hypothetical protein
MGKTYKDLKKQGKHVFDGPEVKQRKHFAPGTKTEKPKKGKGSYNRGNAFEDEDEQDLGEVPPNPNYKKEEKLGSVPLGGGYVKPKPKKKSLGKRIADKFFNRSVSGGKKPYDEDEQTACWDGYKKKGTKKKGSKTVNNCVKESTNLSKFIEAIMTSNHAQAHKQLKDAINSKIQERIAQEIEKPLF